MMRYLATGLLCALGFTAQATTLDYTVSKDPNGFNVYEITKDKVSLIPGGPFDPQAQYVGTDGSYIYAVNEAPGDYYNRYVATYQIVNGQPKKVAQVTDSSLVYRCGGCQIIVTNMIGTPDHLFMLLIHQTDGAGVGDDAHIYHKKAGGGLTFMCDIGFQTNYLDNYTSSITKVRVDSSEIYAYIDYIDLFTQLPMTGIYDISTSACKQVGTLPR